MIRDCEINSRLYTRKARIVITVSKAIPVRAFAVNETHSRTRANKKVNHRAARIYFLDKASYVRVPVPVYQWIAYQSQRVFARVLVHDQTKERVAENRRAVYIIVERDVRLIGSVIVRGKCICERTSVLAFRSKRTKKIFKYFS